MRIPRPWALPQQPTTRTELLVPGVTEAMLRTQLASGRLLRLRPQVYLAADAWPDEPAARHVMLGRAAQVAHPGLVLSHGTAGVVWSLPSPLGHPWHEGPVSLLRSRASGGRAPVGTATHWSSHMPNHHITRDPDGYAVTTVARTATDLARDLSLPDALAVLDAAARKLVDRLVVKAYRREFANPRLIRVALQELEEAATTCRADLGSVLDLTDPRRETPIESISAAHFHLAGLPAPECQAEIHTPAGILYPDF